MTYVAFLPVSSHRMMSNGFPVNVEPEKKRVKLYGARNTYSDRKNHIYRHSRFYLVESAYPSSSIRRKSNLRALPRHDSVAASNAPSSPDSPESSSVGSLARTSSSEDSRKFYGAWKDICTSVDGFIP